MLRSVLCVCTPDLLSIVMKLFLDRASADENSGKLSGGIVISHLVCKTSFC